MRLIRWINASAGTGKTNKIIELIGELIESGVNPDSILCLTFTNAGAIEMKHRYMLNGFDKVPLFTTIHSFAKQIHEKEYGIADEEMVNQLLQEAIEFVLLEPVWAKFFDLIHHVWGVSGSIFNDIKQVITSGASLKVTFLEKYIKKHYLSSEITLSAAARQALDRHGLNSVVSKILSNDIDIYSSNFVTKDLCLNKKILPKSFLTNPNYVEINEEINQVLQNIVKYVNEYTNSDFLKQSLTCNLFIKEVANTYQNLKKTYNLCDYNDLIKYGIHSIKESSEKLMHLRHVFIDEAQDTTEIQWKFLYMALLEIMQVEDSSFTVLGDKKQIIYEFNGASETVYTQMRTKLRQTIKALNGVWQEIELNKSYRSSQVILDFVDSVMTSSNYECKHSAALNLNGYIKTWLPAAGNKDHLIVNKGWIIPGPQSVPVWISMCIDELNNLIGKQKLLNKNRLIEPDDITILVPRRCVQNFLLYEYLKQSNIPVKICLFGMSIDETVQDLLAAASIALDPKNDLMVTGLLKSLYFGWSNAEIEDLIINREDTVWNLLSKSDYPKAQAAMQTMQEWLQFPKDLLSFYAKLIFHTDFGQHALKNFHSEVVVFWEKVMNSLNLSLSEFIANMQNTSEPLNLDKRGVSILTTHAAKGKEFEIVFLCNSHLSIPRNTSTQQIIHDNIFLLKGNYDLYKNMKNKILLSQENESDRLLYVALTRAREQIYILPPLSTDNINPKSWYSKIIKNIHLFQKVGDAYEINTQTQAQLSRKL